MRISVLASVLIVGGVSSVMASGSVDAAVIPDPVTAITVSPSNPRITDPVRTDIVWCVPDSSTAGDTFEVALPPELTQLPRNFNLRDPDGILVATALITGTPAVVTFTFNSYVDTHTGVCGTAFFESRLDASLIPGNTYPLTYVVNHVTTFEPVITIRPGAGPTGRDSAKKGAFFADPNDECRTVAEACLGWHIETQLGPFQSVTINDTATAGTTFVCSQVTVRLWSVNANGSLASSFAPASGTVSVTCSPGQLQVIVSNVPADRLVRVLLRATPLVIDPAGGVTFVNAATVTHVFPNQTVDEDSIAAQRRSALVGGDANGVVPPTTTTTTAPPTVGSTTTTSIVSALPPSAPPAAVPPAAEPQLPATGSDTTVLLTGIVFLAGGLALAIAGSRRRKVA